MSKKYRSDAMAAIHETMEALHDVGAIGKQTMRRFDDACLAPIRPLKPETIAAIREGMEQISRREGVPLEEAEERLRMKHGFSR